jgi:hypothetical protein
MIDNQLLIDAIESAREYAIRTVNLSFDRLLAHADTANGVGNSDIDGYSAKTGEYSVPITSNSAIFAGRVPIFVSIGGELKYVMSWREVVCAVLEHCNQDPIYRERLMKLRGKPLGKSKPALSDTPIGLTRSAKINENLYVEVHHCSKALRVPWLKKYCLQFSMTAPTSTWL